MTLYHGSNTIVETPCLIAHNRFLDFGNGFYTTPNKDQALRFAQIVVQRRGGAEIVTMLFSAEEAVERLRAWNLYDQATFCTERALGYIRFSGVLEP
jgi:hypothetical protein